MSTNFAQSTGSSLLMHQSANQHKSRLSFQTLELPVCTVAGSVWIAPAACWWRWGRMPATLGSPVITVGRCQELLMNSGSYLSQAWVGETLLVNRHQTIDNELNLNEYM